MARADYLFTSESVSEGHPDKVCDRISDEVVDLFFKEAAKSGMDPWAVRVACETLATTNRVVIAGEVRTSLDEKAMKSKVKSAARKAIKAIGYEQDGFHWKKAKIDVLLHPQSADIAVGVDAAGNKDEGAGDQGIMFGYACRETPELMPAPIYYSHKILEVLTKYRKEGERGCGALGPDAKSQVTVKYEGGKPVGVTQIVLSTQHLDEKLTSARTCARSSSPSSARFCPRAGSAKDTVWHVNPTGKFVIGGPDGDAGPDRPQDHRRHLWRRSPPWRRRLLRQGSDQGRPLGRLCGALSREECRGCEASRIAARSSSPTPSAWRSRFRSMSTCYGTGKVDEAKLEAGAGQGHGPQPARHPQASRPQQADLRQELGLWPFRPQARP